MLLPWSVLQGGICVGVGGGVRGEVMVEMITARHHSSPSGHNTGSVSRLESSDSGKLEPEIIGLIDQSGLGVGGGTRGFLILRLEESVTWWLLGAPGTKMVLINIISPFF